MGNDNGGPKEPKRLRGEEWAAITLGLKKTSLQKWRQKNKGPKFIKLGRRVLYDPDDVQAYIDARRQETSNER